MAKLTKNQARNMFYGGTAFFFIIFIILVLNSVNYVENESTPPVTEDVVHGKEVWERHSCINCHTLMGEGAYFAPELGNVWVRYGGDEDPEAARKSLKTWIRSMPTGIEGRRQMPHFDMTEEELDDLIDFLKWTSEVDTQNWPPTEEG